MQRFTVQFEDGVADELRLEAARRRMSVAGLVVERTLAGRECRSEPEGSVAATSEAAGSRPARVPDDPPFPQPDELDVPLRNAARVNAPSGFKPDPRPGPKPGKP